jgi:hypothetical protein
MPRNRRRLTATAITVWTFAIVEAAAIGFVLWNR